MKLEQNEKPLLFKAFIIFVFPLDTLQYNSSKLCFTFLYVPPLVALSYDTLLLDNDVAAYAPINANTIFNINNFI